MSVRLMIADFHPVVRAGLFSFFHNTDIQIIDEATTGEQLLQRVEQQPPDAILLDTSFPDIDGFQLVQQLRERNYQGRIIFFSSSDQMTSYARAVAVGANSYLLKKTSRIELIRIVRAVAHSDDAAYSGELRHASTAMKLRPLSDPLSPLTPREAQVLRQIAYGLSNKEIASAMKLSIDTVKEHVQNVLRKLNVCDRTQAAVWAVRNNIY